MKMSTKILITTILLPLLLVYTKQTPSDGVNYGLGGYTMDDDKQQMMVPEHALLLKTDDDVKKYKTNKHTDKQFNPCRVELNKDNEFEVFYDDDTANEGCTVDFVTDQIDEIKTNIKVKDAKMGCLEECGGNEFLAVDKNIVPFTYSMSNDDIKKLYSGPPYIEDQISCEESCTENGGKCMASPTSLQLAWTKCQKVKAWILLVGEPVSSWRAETKDNEIDEATFELSIEMGDNPHYPGNNVPLFTIAGQRFLYKEDSGGNYIYPDCFVDDELPMIPVPQFWTINSGNAQINGKQLLVFHFLPQAATRIFNEKGKLQGPPAPGMPNCKGKLSMIFENVAGLLQMPQQRDEITTASEVSTNISNATTTAVIWEAESTAGAGDDRALLIAIGAGGAVLLLVIVIFLVWCLCCRKKKKKRQQNKDAEIGNWNDEYVDSMTMTVQDHKQTDEDRNEDSRQEHAQNHDEGVLVPDTVEDDRSEREDNSKNHDEGVLVPDTVEDDRSEREDNSKNRDEGVLVPDTVESEREDNSKNRDEDATQKDVQNRDEDEKEEDSKNRDEVVLVTDTVGSAREDNSKNRDEDATQEDDVYSRYIDPKMTER